MAYNTLTQLEEEPVTGLFGLTFTEVRGLFIKCFFILVVISVIAAFFLPIAVAFLIGIAAAVVSFLAIAKSSSSKRTDKPLHYGKHLRLHKNARFFIQPAKQYQRERTNYGKPQK